MARTQTFSNGETLLNVRKKLNSIADWTSSYSYNQNDVTSYNGVLYYSLIDNNTNYNPTSSFSQWKQAYVNITTGSTLPITASNALTASSYNVITQITSSYIETSSVATSYSGSYLTINNGGDEYYGGTLFVDHGMTYGGNLSIGSEFGKLVILGISDTIFDSHIRPNVADTYDIGEDGNNWNTIFVNSVRGNVTGSLKGIASTASYWDSSSLTTLVNTKQNQLISGSTLPITSSVSNISIYWDSSSLVSAINTKQNQLISGSTLPITSSWSNNSAVASTVTNQSVSPIFLKNDVWATQLKIDGLLERWHFTNNLPVSASLFVGNVQGTASNSSNALTASHVLGTADTLVVNNYVDSPTVYANTMSYRDGSGDLILRAEEDTNYVTVKAGGLKVIASNANQFVVNGQNGEVDIQSQKLWFADPNYISCNGLSFTFSAEEMSSPVTIGPLVEFGEGVTGNLLGTASVALNSETASYLQNGGITKQIYYRDGMNNPQTMSFVNGLLISDTQ